MYKVVPDKNLAVWQKRGGKTLKNWPFKTEYLTYFNTFSQIFNKISSSLTILIMLKIFTPFTHQQIVLDVDVKTFCAFLYRS